MFFRLIFIPFCLVLTASACHRPPEKPHVIFIMVDTLRQDYLGLYGFEGNISPHLDRFADESFVFENAYTPSSWTRPAIVSLFTAKDAACICTHICYGTRAISKSDATLAKDFKERGYKTAALVGNYLIRSEWGYDVGFSSFVEPSSWSEFSDQDLLRRGSDLINSTTEPLFLYIHLMGTHIPYSFNETFFNELKDSPSLGDNRILTDGDLERGDPNIRASIPFQGQEKFRELRTWRGTYASSIRVLDENLNLFLKDLSNKKILDKSIVIVTADHGEGFFEHDVTGHGNGLTDELIRIPLIIRFPSGKKGRIKGSVSLSDLRKMLANFIDDPLTRRLDRYPQSYPLGRKIVSGCMGIPLGQKDRKIGFSIQDEQFKLIWTEKEKFQFFDRVADPKEQINTLILSIDKAKPYINQLNTIMETAGDCAPGKEVATLPKDYLEQIKSLGYAN